MILPGSTRVLDWETGELVDCTPELCPHAIDGVNHAPFAAFGGWSGAINAPSDPKVIEAAYDFLSYMNEPEQSNVDVTIGWTGYNPYRISQFENLEPWVEAGFSQEFAENYLGAIGDSLNSPNMASDLRIPGTQRYEGIVLDRELARYLAGEVTAEEALQNVHDGWEEITEEFGRDEQLAAVQGLARHHQLIAPPIGVCRIGERSRRRDRRATAGAHGSRPKLSRLAAAGGSRRGSTIMHGRCSSCRPC